MHLAYPPKFCITIVFDFSWDDCEIPRRNWKQWLCKILGGKQGACIMVYVKMVACTFLRMYVKVHWNFNVPFRNEQLFLHFLALSFRFSTKHLPMRITFGRKYVPSTKFHQLKKICQDLTVQYKIYQFVGVRGTPSKMSPIVFMWWYLSSHIYIYFLFSSWRIF